MHKLLIVALLAFAPLVQASTVEPRSFDDPAQEVRYKRLITELRCPVCQNQDLADSNADLAKDLRDDIYTMVKAGQTDEQILGFMVKRYGDFALYRPPLRSTTFLLWFGPLLLTLTGVGILVVQVRRRAAARAPQALSPEERERLDELLHETGEEPR